jgi:hypothetical protein
MWHGHFASNITLMSIMMHQLHPSRLMHENISLHQGYPHYVWRLKMDLVTTRFMTKFSISMSLKIFGHQLSVTIVDNQNFLVTNFWSPQITIKFFNMTENIGSCLKNFSCLINNDHWSKDWKKNCWCPKILIANLGDKKLLVTKLGNWKILVIDCGDWKLVTKFFK